jgi:hypothetical protein
MERSNRLSRGGAWVVALGVLCLLPGVARAEQCKGQPALQGAPIALTLGPADFGATPPTCVSTGVALEGRGTALIDTPDFYGALSAEAVLAGSFALGEATWVSAAVNVLRYRFVQNASVVGTHLGVGPTSVGLHRVMLRGERWRVAPYARLLLPTETGRNFSVQLGLEPGASASFEPLPGLSLGGGLSLPVTVVVLGERTLWQLAPRASLDAAYAPWRWLELAVGAELRLALEGGGLDFVAPKVAVRLYPWRTLHVQLAGMMPLVGLERTDFRGSLGLGASW